VCFLPPRSGQGTSWRDRCSANTAGEQPVPHLPALLVEFRRGFLTGMGARLRPSDSLRARAGMARGKRLAALSRAGTAAISGTVGFSGRCFFCSAPTASRPAFLVSGNLLLRAAASLSLPVSTVAGRDAPERRAHGTCGHLARVPGSTHTVFRRRALVLSA